MYRKIVNRILSLSKKYGKKTSHIQQVEFFFYANSEDEVSNLAIELSKRAYNVYRVERAGEKWSIIGATPLMKIDEASLVKWGKSMYDLADEMNVVFDGWGMLIE